MKEKRRHRCVWFDEARRAFCFRTGRGFIYAVELDKVKTTPAMLRILRRVEAEPWCVGEHIETFLGCWCRVHGRRRRWSGRRLAWLLPMVE